MATHLAPGSSRIKSFSFCNLTAWCHVTLIPSKHIRMLGSIRLSQETSSLPYNLLASQYPRSSPGTAADLTPEEQIRGDVDPAFKLTILTSFGQFCVAGVHVRPGGGGRSFSGVQRDDLVLLPQVEGHEESAANAHAVRVDDAVAEEGGDGRVHHSAVPSEHIAG